LLSKDWPGGAGLATEGDWLFLLPPGAEAPASLPRTFLRASLPAQQHHFPTKSASPPAEGSLASADVFGALRTREQRTVHVYLT